MGISLEFQILPWSVAPHVWAEAYDESLRLLRAHPARLVGLRDERVRGLRRLVYSRELEHDVKGPERRWHIVGDCRSGQTGESFELYRDLRRYRRASRPARRPVDAAVEAFRDLRVDGPSTRSRVVTVFSSKTQGCPYHEPLVAVMALLEQRLGIAAFARGDIGRDEAERACAWAGRVLGRRLEPPVCLRPDALHDRLAAHLEGEALLDACLDLHQGPRHRALAAIAARIDRRTLERWFARLVREEAGGGRPDQIGVLQSFEAWLHATGDFDALATIACTHPAGPRFSRADLAGAAVEAWQIRREAGLDAKLHAWVAGMGLPLAAPEKPPRRAAWPAPRIVVGRLARLFPEDRAAIVASVERTCARHATAGRGPGRTRGADLKPSTGLGELLPSVPDVIARDGLPLSAAGLLLRGAGIAAHRTATACRDDREIGRALRGGPEEAWKIMVHSTDGRALFEDTWVELDEERDVDFLLFIVALMVQAGHEPHATACRVLLWDLPLCRRLHRATSDASWRRAMERLIVEGGAG